MLLVRRAWPAAMVVLAAAGVGAVLFDRAIRPSGPLGWDEAYHALWALRIAADIEAGDLLGLLYDSYRQVYWPPLFSWYAGTLILLGGPSTEIVRSAGLIALVGAALFGFAAGRDLAGRGAAGIVGGLTATGVLLLSGAMLELAPQAMLELPAVACLLAGLWLYGRIWQSERASTWAWASLGALVVLTFLAKQNYGVLLGLALAGGFLVDGEWLRRRPSDTVGARRRGQIVAALAASLLLVIWFAYPQKLVQTVQSLRNTPWGPAVDSIDGLLFYPRHLIWLAGSWLMLGVWVAAVGAALRPVALRDGRIRVLLFLVAIQLVFAQVSATKIDRHILPLVPAAALLSAAFAGWIAGYRPAVASAGLIVLAVSQAITLLPTIRPVTSPEGWAALEAAVAATTPGETLIVGSIDLPMSPATLDWELIRAGRLTVDGAGSLSLASEERFASGALPRLPQPAQEPLGRLARRWPGAAGGATIYVGLPLDAPDLEVRAATLETAITGAAGRRGFLAGVAIVPPTSPRFPDATIEAIGRAFVAAGFRQEGEATRAVMPIAWFRR
ncbi:MAG: hypothetical protein U0556_12285 [Dehalococcoidia bacterium]